MSSPLIIKILRGYIPANCTTNFTRLLSCSFLNLIITYRFSIFAENRPRFREWVRDYDLEKANRDMSTEKTRKKRRHGCESRPMNHSHGGIGRSGQAHPHARNMFISSFACQLRVIVRDSLFLLLRTVLTSSSMRRRYCGSAAVSEALNGTFVDPSESIREEATAVAP